MEGLGEDLEDDQSTSREKNSGATIAQLKLIWFVKLKKAYLFT